MNKVADQFSVSAVMLKQVSQHPWGSDSWSLVGTVPGLSQAELSQQEKKGLLHIWPNLHLQLHQLHCDSYYHNLVSIQPKIYLVCSLDENSLEPPQPLLLTVDYDEAASYMETGELVFNADLPEVIYLFLERFVLTHYQPKELKKRHRQKWHNDEKKL